MDIEDIKRSREAALRANAAWASLYEHAREFHSQIVDGNCRKAERLREEAHAILDSMFDLGAEAAIVWTKRK